MKNVMLKVFTVAAVLGASEILSATEPKLGETWCVSTKNIQLREKADAFSQSLRALKYGDKVKITGLVSVAVPYNGDKDRFPDNLMPRWVQVDAGGTQGYLPIPSLASEWLMGNQDPEVVIGVDGTFAKRGFSETESDVQLASMRGFSESEKADLVSMRGAAGSASKVAAANPAMVSDLIKKNISVSSDEISAFCAEGGLSGDGRRETTVLEAEKKSMFGSIFSGSRKLAAGGLGFASKTASALAPNNNLIGAASEAGGAVSGLIYSEVGPVQEFQIGRVVASCVLPQYRLLDFNHPLSKYVRNVGASLCATSNDPMPYGGTMFWVVQSDEVNAFAVPGGFVFITTGMLKFLRDEDELAAILGHEIGHLELRHGMKAVGTENVLKLFTLAAKVGGGATSNDSGSSLAQQQLTQLANGLFEKMTSSIRNGYDIEMEQEADWRSVQFSIALGYDSKALYDVLERFKKEKGSYGGASYPAERGADVLRYREGFSDSDGASQGRQTRAARYKAAVVGL